jgi:hypothetical protein
MPRKAAKRRAQLPRPSSVVEEAALLPGRSKAALARLAAADVPTAMPQAYRIVRTNQVDGYEKPMAKAAVRSFTATAAAPAGNAFKGTARKAAKVSIAAAPIEEFDDLKALIATLPAEAGMINHVPRITKGAKSDRVLEEKRNVRVKAFLYAHSVEDDNDYHLIIGRKPGLARMFMTVEISGLPPKSSKHHARLKAARDAYKTFFAGRLPDTSYDFPKPPTPVEITGSLFFDINHATGGRPGPDDLRPDIPVIWEIHPISKIVLEP